MANRGPKISPTVKKLIVSEATIRCPNKPRAALAVELKDTIERMGIYAEGASPSEDTLMRMISAARNEEHNSLDKPWHLGSMLDSERYITPEAIAYIFKVKEWATRNKEIPITIRQAYWIGQFYPGIPDIRKAKDEDFKNLWLWSLEYAHYELICELSKTDFNTTDLDYNFWHGGPALSIVWALKNDIKNGTRNVKKASDILAGRKVNNERPHNKKSQE